MTQFVRYGKGGGGRGVKHTSFKKHICICMLFFKNILRIFFYSKSLKHIYVCILFFLNILRIFFYSKSLTFIKDFYLKTLSPKTQLCCGGGGGWLEWLEVKGHIPKGIRTFFSSPPLAQKYIKKGSVLHTW